MIKKMFDYESLALKYNIKQNHLEKIITELRNDFPSDEMMVELHAIRVLKNTIVAPPEL